MDGTLEVPGRNDGQVKIRGHRIELGEVEAAIRRDAEVASCVVVARAGIEGLELAAYVTPESVDPVRLRRALTETIPLPMIPSTFTKISALPLTPNGKIDRKALPPPSPKLESNDTPATPPADDVETAIARFWREGLAVETIGLDEDVFALGAHSLLAMGVIAKIYSEFGVEISVLRLFREPTVKGIAGLVREALEATR